MSVQELDISWASTGNERRRLRWELMSAEDVRGVFLTTHEDVLVVLWKGDVGLFQEFARTLARDAVTANGHAAIATTNNEGAFR
jgi:hypothetical protein